jgi:hypoxanthine phosphoribosyltransferase
MLVDLEKTLFSRQQIAARVREMASRISRDLALVRGGDDGPAQVVFVPVLTGSVIFVADLVRELPIKLRLRLVTVSSYPGKSVQSKGAAIRGELPADLGGKHVVLIDDILDSGQTLAILQQAIREQGPASLRTCVLLRKPPACRRGEGASVEPEYVGFDIPDEFVVGYGLDYDGYYRNHPEIATLKPTAR